MRLYDIRLEDLTHRNFLEVKAFLEDNIDDMVNGIEKSIRDFLKDYFSYTSKATLAEIDGRTMSGAFRRHDFLEGIENRMDSN